MKIKWIHDNCSYANADLFEDAKLIDAAAAVKYFPRFSLTEGGFDATGPVIVNYRENGQRRNCCAEEGHVLIVGGTGTGKTQCYYMAQAEAFARSENRPSVFFMDLKGEYYRNFAGLYESRGYKVYVLNCKRPFESSRYNPLLPAWKAYREAMEIRERVAHADPTDCYYGYSCFEEWKHHMRARELTLLEACENRIRRLAMLFITVESQKDPSWEIGAQNMFFLLAWGMLEDSNDPAKGMTAEKFTLGNICRIASATEDDCEVIHHWIDEHDTTSCVRNLNNYYTRNARITRDGYMSVFSVKTDKLRNISFDWLTSASDILTENIIAQSDGQPAAIFCITDETRPESYDLCMAFMDDLIATIKIHSDECGEAKRDFHILADEFANMPPMPNITNRIATLRSYRCWLHIGVQSFDQLDDRYGDKVRNIILDNCNCQVFFGTNNIKTVREFAESLGEREGSVTSYGIGNDNRVSLSISPADRPLVRKSDLAGLKLGEAYVKMFRHPTLFTRLEPHFISDDLYRGHSEPERIIADLDALEASVYDIHKLPPKRKNFNFDF